jgi:ABC-type Zn uptake system ZnuABC Zn-binding protein ZnuA
VLYALPFFLLWIAAAAWGADPLYVVTTSTDLKALVQVVGGERVEVESLAPPLHDPHALEVKASQLYKIKRASLLVRIGLDHEPWLGRALRTLSDRRFVRDSPNYLDTSKGIQLLQAETPRIRADKGTHLHGVGNTHYWLDPENSKPITAEILEAVARLAPGERRYFEANRKRFLHQLDERLKIWSRAMARLKGTRMVTVHETWPYFAQRFGLIVVGVAEPTPGVPPSPSYLATLIQQMRASGVRLLIAEPYSNASVISQIAAQSGATAITLIPSVAGDPEASDYLRLFDLNIKRLSSVTAAGR